MQHTTTAFRGAGEIVRSVQADIPDFKGSVQGLCVYSEGEHSKPMTKVYSIRWILHSSAIVCLFWAAGCCSDITSMEYENPKGQKLTEELAISAGLRALHEMKLPNVAAVHLDPQRPPSQGPFLVKRDKAQETEGFVLFRDNDDTKSDSSWDYFVEFQIVDQRVRVKVRPFDSKCELYERFCSAVYSAISFMIVRIVLSSRC